MDVAYARQVKPRGMSKAQCYSCKEHGHLANQCNKKLCNHCKKPGHSIVDCRRRPQNKGNGALHTSHSDACSSANAQQPTQPAVTASRLTPKIAQQMIQSTFSALSLTGKTNISPLWFVNSGASKDITPYWRN